MADVTVRPEVMCDFFTKFHLDGLPQAAVLHRFTDVDRGDPHDHPWGFRSIILFGGYIEEVFNERGDCHGVVHEAGDSFEVKAGHVHRIVKLLALECWTLILPGAPERKSGFYRWEEGRALHRFWDETEFRPVEAGAA